MITFKQYLKEAGIVNMERYIRAHGKRPKSDGGPANYMFTVKRFGEPDHNDAKQVFAVNDTWNNAKKAVAKWAKENKISSVYMMEEQNPENAEAEAANRKKQTGKGSAPKPTAKKTDQAGSGQNKENAEAEASNRQSQKGKGPSKVGIK